MDLVKDFIVFLITSFVMYKLFQTIGFKGTLIVDIIWYSFNVFILSGILPEILGYGLVPMILALLQYGVLIVIISLISVGMAYHAYQKSDTFSGFAGYLFLYSILAGVILFAIAMIFISFFM